MEDFERALLGHLSLKSSALCTKGESRTKQFMTANYMVSHYKKLQNVKSCVDTKPPKAMLYSTKARDQKLRQLTKSNSSAIAAIKALLSVKNPNLGYLSPTIESQKLDGRSAIKTKPPKLDPTDILDIHSYKFTSGKPFVPRTNKSNCPSRLSQLNIYNPPPRAKSECQSQRSNSSMASSRDDQYSEYSQNDQTKTPKNKNLLKNSESINFDKPTMRLKSQRLSVTRTTTGEITLRSPPPSLSHPSNLDVPPLNISLDQDNILWLKDLSDRRSKKTDLGSTTSLEQQLSLNTRDLDKFGTLKSTLGNESNAGLETSTNISDLKNLEEDCKYIEFLQEVTADILQKGSYTNKVLTKIFEYHIDKHRNQLKEYKMREMLNELRKDLGAQYDNDDEIIDGDVKIPSTENDDYKKSNEVPKKQRNPATKKHLNVNLMENLSNNDVQKEINSKKLKQSRSNKESKQKKEKIKIDVFEKAHDENCMSTLIKEEDNVDSIHKWLNKQNEDKNPELESAKSDERKKEIAKKTREEDDETIATISSINDDDGDQDTEDLLEYYNTTIVNDDDFTNQRCDNGFNRTTLSDIPEMSYRSEMVKQRSTDEEVNKHTQNGESDGIEKSIGFSGLEGEISSRISSSRSRRRAAMNIRSNEMNSARSSTIDTNRDVNTVKEENSKASSEQKNSTCENLKTQLFDDEERLETSNVPTKSTGTSENLETENDFVQNAEYNNDEINLTTRMSSIRSEKNNYDEQKTENDYSGDDKYDDDIEEECSISIDDVTELSEDDYPEKTNRSNSKSDV